MRLPYMLPYKDTRIRQACDTGLPPMRALWRIIRTTPKRKLARIFVGPTMLVAQLVERGLKVRSVYLPPGGWFDWWTGNQLQGGR